MPENEKPTLHLEGLVLEAEVKQGGTPPKEFRKVKMGNLWLSCWTPALYPLMVKGKYLAIDYITSQRGAFTNYNIQEATEIVAPKEPAQQGNGYRDSRESSIEAQVAAYCTAQMLAVRMSSAAGFQLREIPIMIAEFYQGMQRAKQTGAAAHTTEAIPSSPTEPISKTPKAATPNSEPEDSPFPEASSAAAPTKSKEADITPTEFWKQWREAGLPTGPDLPAVIERVTKDRGDASTIEQARKAGWSYRELLEEAKKPVGLVGRKELQ